MADEMPVFVNSLPLKHFLTRPVQCSHLQSQSPNDTAQAQGMAGKMPVPSINHCIAAACLF